MSFWQVLFVGLCCAFGGPLLCWKEELASPKSENFPTHSLHTRITGWTFGGALFYRGIVILISCQNGRPTLDDGSGVYASFFLTAFIVSRLVDTLDDKAPATAWRRMNQMHHIMRCRSWRPFLNWLRSLIGLGPIMDKPDPDRTRTVSALIGLDDQVIAPGQIPDEWRPKQ